jgi:uncharacterized protein YjbI with pentapeptide repeats
MLSCLRRRHANLRLALLFSVFVSLVGLNVAPVAACSGPPGPPSWFRPQYTVDDVPLPPGITIKDGPSGVEIANHSATPVYTLLVDKYDPKIPYPTEPIVPVGMYAETKVIRDQQFTFDGETWVQGSRSLQFTPQFVDHTRSGNDRPRDVVLPEPQHSRFAFLYDDRVIVVPVTLSYTLNESYDPIGYQQSLLAGCGNLGELLEQVVRWLGIGSVIGVASFLTLWSIVVWNRKPELDPAIDPTPEDPTIYTVKETAWNQQQRWLRNDRLKWDRRRNAVVWGIFLVIVVLVLASQRTSLRDCMPYCANANLRGMEFYEAQLRDLDLRRANLRNAGLHEANLMYSDLSNADLRGANLSSANMRGANLDGADLRGATLDGVDLRAAQNTWSAKLDPKWRLLLELASPSNQKRDLQDQDLSGMVLGAVAWDGVNLSRANLQNINLRGANLHGANLAGADLERADLSDADLTGADLSGTNLNSANLRETRLADVLVDERTVFTGGSQFVPQILRDGAGRVSVPLQTGLQDLDLRGVNLQNADMQNADLRQVFLSGARLDRANLSRSDLSGARFSMPFTYNDVIYEPAQMREAQLQEASLVTATLRGVDLQRANLRSVKAVGADFQGSDLSFADLGDADLRGATLYAATLRGSILGGATLFVEGQRANLVGADLHGVDLRRVDLRDAFLSGANLALADLRGADLRGADLSYAAFRGALIDDATQIDGRWRAMIDLQTGTRSAQPDANLRATDLRSLNLVDIDLRDADLREADLRQSSLRGASLSGADLRGADLREVDLRGADLRGADLRGARLHSAAVDATTQLDPFWRLVFDLHQQDGVGRDLHGIDFHDVDLRNVDLRDANLRGANLRGADLRGVQLGGADLMGAVLDYADVRDLVLHGVKYDPDQLARARKY